MTSPGEMPPSAEAYDMYYEAIANLGIGLLLDSNPVEMVTTAESKALLEHRVEYVLPGDKLGEDDGFYIVHCASTDSGNFFSMQQFSSSKVEPMSRRNSKAVRGAILDDHSNANACSFLLNGQYTRLVGSTDVNSLRKMITVMSHLDIVDMQINGGGTFQSEDQYTLLLQLHSSVYMNELDLINRELAFKKINRSTPSSESLPNNQSDQTPTNRLGNLGKRILKYFS